MNRVTHDKKNTGRLLGRVKKAASNAFATRNQTNHETPDSKLNYEGPEAPSHHSLSHETRRSGRRDKIKLPKERDGRVSFLDQKRSSLIDEILGKAPPNAPRSSYYSLGDVGKEEHMVTFNGFEESLVAIAQLKEMDHAFVQRSNGEWRYSVVVATSKADTNEDPFLKFLVDDKGHTKEIPLRQWTKLIRLPAKTNEDNLDSKADLMLSSMAVDGDEFSGNNCFRKNHSDPEVPKSRRQKYSEDNRRKSESCILKPSRRLSGRRRVCPTNSVSSSFTSSRIPQDFGMRRDSGSTEATHATVRTSFRQRYSEMDSLKGSWRLSSVDPEPKSPSTTFDIKFNQHAFLSALASISETSQPL
eukprot:CCRYP_017822-RA/>CCRYP_017822-RA protein AED:0.27 eAED:0.27 QI:0/-1/0/1/-1/1/1/0/357